MGKSDGLGPNVWLIDEMRQQYRRDPASVSETWAAYFEDEPTSKPALESKPELESSPAPGPKKAAPSGQADQRPLRGVDAALAQRMTESLTVPTATSVRVVPAKLLEVNRNILNNHLARARGGKVSFTHLIGWAIVKALASSPEMTSFYSEPDGKPKVVRHAKINLGLAVDVKREGQGRTLVVPNIRSVESLTFSEFFAAYEDLIRKVRSKKLTPEDFAGTTITITNPGTLGTAQSVPRLMSGQAAIIGVGAIGYPAEYKGADPEILADIGIGKVVTITSTYDHRVIQGATSGEFLAEIERLLVGGSSGGLGGVAAPLGTEPRAPEAANPPKSSDGFYEEIFREMGVPYVPVQWGTDSNPARNTVEAEEKQAGLFQLINLYRVRGHLIADLDPLDTEPPKMHPDLDPAGHGFTIWDLDRKFITGGLSGKSELKLGEILKVLRDAYCRTVGVEYMHISEPEEKHWIQERVEGSVDDLSHEEHARILTKLNESEAFETFLHKKYIGHKRFSLEGAEALIPLLSAVLDGASAAQMDEAVVGMAHRGRLNVLANIVGRSYSQIFKEFEGDIDPESTQGSGDVKYHLGAEGEYVGLEGHRVHISLVSNPSHLEAVDPVVEGFVRAKQDAGDKTRVLPILIHGDAAFAGQGVVAETLNLSQLRGYSTGGTVHVIINNQLGFTTAPGQARSSTYASDVAKMIQAPILHVNGDDPEACVRIARLAFDYRQKFHKDVFIDMWCYRKWGHNEADEPAFTQPLMYQRIAARKSCRKLYTELLLQRGDMTLEEAESALAQFRANLQQAFDATKESEPSRKKGFMRPVGILPVADTAVARPILEKILDALSQMPPGFNVHPKLAKWAEGRHRALDEGTIDFSLGEAFAFGSLLLDGVSIRLAGQDTRRGTFSQRHSVLIDQLTGDEHCPLSTIATADSGGFAASGAPESAPLGAATPPAPRTRFAVYDSLLSEFAALGFEYGYSVAAKDTLVIWESQFGDFANGGQIIIDQFIAAGEDKWGQPSNLTLLLPHGYEGQGPEHSSARLERFLQLGAAGNIQVVVPSTPAQYFHLLRRQGKSQTLRPLVVMTPKSLLRLPAAKSASVDITEGRFFPVLPDPFGPAPGEASRVILVSGKVYYDLKAERDRRGLSSVALVRVEQLYPFPADEIAEELSRLLGAGKESSKADVMWVQEEPANSGAWRYMHQKCMEKLELRLLGCTRDESPSTATGSASAHQREQAALISQALADVT